MEKLLRTLLGESVDAVKAEDDRFQILFHNGARLDVRAATWSDDQGDARLLVAVDPPIAELYDWVVDRSA